MNKNRKPENYKNTGWLVGLDFFHNTGLDFFHKIIFFHKILQGRIDKDLFLTTLMTRVVLYNFCITIFLKTS